MSHPAQMEFIGRAKSAFADKFVRTKVLEIGSLNINGTIRPFFEVCDYTGIDVAPGRDVDVVSQGQEFKGGDGEYDVTVSCECFEHNPEWVPTFANMIRMTKKGGLVLMTCATTGRSEHGTSRTTPENSPLTVGIGWDYYKNLTADDFLEQFKFDEIFEKYEFLHNSAACDLYFWGLKS